MTRIAVIFAAVLLAFSLAAAYSGEVGHGRLRFSASPEKVRVVLDLPANATIADLSALGQPRVLVDLPLAEEIAPVVIRDPIVTGAQVTADAQGRMVLAVTLSKARKCRVFTLPPMADGSPFRVVVDVLKRFAREETRALTPAITYTLIERQSDEDYFAAHLLRVDLNDPQVRVGVEAARGERETVASMAARTSAVGGVNGGFFVAGTRPVGLLKAGGQVRSLPIWGRTALAFPAEGPPFLGNPRGEWLVTLPDGSGRAFPDHLDASVLPAAVSTVVSGNNFTQAPAHPGGLTALIRNGAVALRATAAVPLLPGEFALCVTGADLPQLEPLLVAGAAVGVTAVLPPPWCDVPAAVGGGPRLLRQGEVAIPGAEERMKSDVLNGAAARTGVGLTATNALLLVVVEGSGPYGRGGATLRELALLLKAQGAREAMNLDGGGSSALALEGTTVNVLPGAWVRPVASGVLVYDARWQSPSAAKAPPAP